MLYHGAWAITIVTFDVPREIYAHNMPGYFEIITNHTIVSEIICFLYCLLQNHDSPLCLACKSDNADTVNILLSYDADVNAKGDVSNLC